MGGTLVPGWYRYSREPLIETKSDDSNIFFQSLPYESHFNLHSLAILLLANLAMIVNIPNIDIHLDEVIKNRRDRMVGREMIDRMKWLYNSGTGDIGLSSILPRVCHLRTKPLTIHI